LALEGIQVAFAGVHALDGVDVTLSPGEILGLIGPNGAGKTTLINVASGYQVPTAGRLRIDDRDVTAWLPRKLFAAGLSRTFQEVRLFWRLTALENVEVGLVGRGSSRRHARTRAAELLDYFGLGDHASKAAEALTRGDQRRLGIVRSLAGEPRFLLLDEPAAGLNEVESDELLATLRRVRDEFSCALLIVEHDMPLVMRLCDRVQVLDYGKTIAIGPPAVIREDPAVLTAYLGTQAGAHA
jgi:branched-chain amino acid transport system ATP-binding protein